MPQQTAGDKGSRARSHFAAREAASTRRDSRQPYPTGRSRTFVRRGDRSASVWRFRPRLRVQASGALLFRSSLCDPTNLSVRLTRARLKTLISVLLLAAAVLWLYAPGLSRVPLYLHYDEVFFAIQAQAIAATGHDVSGRFMPVYFESYPGSWFQPAVVYF